MEILISILGAIASIIGAAFTFYKSQDAKKSADDAKKARDQLINTRKTSELTELYSLTSICQKKMTKYGAGGAKEKLQGISHTEDAQEVQTLLQKAQELSIHFRGRQNQAAAFYDTCYELLDSFSNATELDSIKRHGLNISKEIDLFLPVIRKKLDTKKDKVS